MKKLKPLGVIVYECRDCKREINWCKDVKDPRGARCYDCSDLYRKQTKGVKANA